MNCLTKSTNICPFCQSADNTYKGHGTVNFCVVCVMSWGDDEQIQVKAVQPVANSLPADMQERLQETIKGLREASQMDKRLKKLEAVTDEEWDNAANNNR